MAQGSNHYAILGVARDASPDEIREAYFEAARRLHPDANHDPHAVELFLQVQESYDVLSNPLRRSDYDASLPVLEVNAPAISTSVNYSCMSLPRMNEAQLVYVLLDLTSIPDPSTGTTPPLNLCLVLDRSTSMQGARMDMVKSNALQILRQLRPQDIISVVTFSDRAEVLIPATSISDISKVQSRISLIQTKGGTEIYYGLEAGLGQLHRNLSPAYINHLILLTDGRTYGDEEACLKLAEQAAVDGVSISGLGIGDEWNDVFLDKLAGCSGGSTMFVSVPRDLHDILEKKCYNLAKVYAERVSLDLAAGDLAELRYAFRIQPDAGELVIQNPIRAGNIPQFHTLRILFEYYVKPIPEGVNEIILGTGQIKMDIPTRSIPTSKLKLNLRLPVGEAVDQEPTPQAILQCMSFLTLYRMQEKARQEVMAGEPLKATHRLQLMATQLFNRGEKDLAQVILNEADTIQHSQHYSSEGDKRIKFGTKALLLPAGIERFVT
ncbi:MAG: VWA domain-containing protein [Chloroflexi bacterium]|nr:VWA domain-containing protein [Chloroflexota bacterium]